METAVALDPILLAGAPGSAAAKSTVELCKNCVLVASSLSPQSSMTFAVLTIEAQKNLENPWATGIEGNFADLSK